MTQVELINFTLIYYPGYRDINNSIPSITVCMKIPSGLVLHFTIPSKLIL